MQNKENTGLLSYVRLEGSMFANNQSPLNTLHIRNITKHSKTCTISTNMSDDLLIKHFAFSAINTLHVGESYFPTTHLEHQQPLHDS